MSFFSAFRLPDGTKKKAWVEGIDDYEEARKFVLASGAKTALVGLPTPPSVSVEPVPEIEPEASTHAG